jgi:HEAT repeats
MEHKEILRIIKSGLYDELKGEEEKLFIAHLESCSECKKEYESQEELRKTLGEIRNPDVDEQLLHEARIELHSVLRQEASRNSISKNPKGNLNFFFATGFRLAFSGALILLIGFIAGFLVFNNASINNKGEKLVEAPSTGAVNASNPILPDNNAWISNVRFINKNPQTGEVEFTFEATKLVHVSGNINDKKIQNLLLYAMLNEPNPGVRLNTLNAINKDQTQSTNDELEQAIIKVAETDNNPGVRRAAVKSLNNFAFDNDIKNALLFVLQHDTNSSLRIDAINSLVSAKNKGFNFDRSDRNVLKNKSENDQNSYVRVAAQTVLEGSK